MKRYWLFAWDAYDSGGGFVCCFVGSFDSVEEAVSNGKGGCEYGEVVDKDTAIVVKEF